MTGEILIYALVAAGLVFWLRSILGTRHGEERERPNPFAGQAANPSPATDPATDSDVSAGIDAPLGPLALPSDGRVSLAAPELETPLMDIVRLDRGFNLAHFAGGAQDAFVMIVEAFAAGDRDLLKTLLSPGLYAAFDQAITARQTAGQTMHTEIHAIRKTTITDARCKDRMAYVTVRFVADETSVIRAADGAVIEGHPDRVSETIDIWTFGRDTRAKDPTWFLFATREEEAGATSIPSA